ncbi:hypothetical protein CN354_20530 [Bacillus cereus]|nr:hypothetical protein CN354_20530 [Bacillus cereus]
MDIKNAILFFGSTERIAYFFILGGILFYLLDSDGIDPIIGEENLVWAPNAVVGQHSIDALEIVVKRLRDVEAEGGDLDDIVDALKELGGLASRR